MKRILLIFTAIVLSLASCHPSLVIDQDTVRDKVYGGWAGKIIGVQYGAPHEFLHLGRTNDGPIMWDGSNITGALNQDDIYTQLSFMRTFDSLGLDASQEQLAQAFAEAGFELFHANLQARKNWFDGLRPPLTGSSLYNAHADDIDFQIDADFIGFMCPGMPVSARRYCERIGPIINDGDGIYGGVYISALHSLAFFQSDIEQLVEGALACIPQESAYARCISDVLAQYRLGPDDWQAAWRMLHEKWEGHVCAPTLSFNIDAKMNGAYVTIGLLYGGDDLDKTMEITVRCGQDADCNASNAAALWGVIHGFEAIPQTYRDALARLDGQPFAFTPYSWTQAADKALEFAAENVCRSGGRADGRRWKIRAQTPEPEDTCRVSFPGLAYSGSVFAQGGEWRLEGGQWKAFKGLGPDTFVRCGEPGASAEVAFEGRMVTVVGAWEPVCGKVDVYIDGDLARTVDGYMPYPSGLFFLNPDVLFIARDLEPGRHTLRMVIRPDAHPDAQGHDLVFSRIDVYN